MRNPVKHRSGSPVAVILAAGSSRRLGRPKQLLRRGTELLLLRSIALGLQATGRRPVLVIGFEQLRLRSVVRRHRAAVDVVFNPRWAGGMASSLHAGLRRVPRQAPAALILLVDQAWVGRRDLGRLVARWQRQPARAAAAAYAGRIGAPAIIPRRRFRAAIAGEGDQGARHWLRGLGRLSEVAIPAAAYDIDRPDDLERLARRKP